MGHGSKITIINYLREKPHKTMKLRLKRNFACKVLENTNILSELQEVTYQNLCERAQSQCGKRKKLASSVDAIAISEI